MLSRQEGAKQKRALARYAAQADREKAASALRTLREQISAERASRNAALREASGRCRAERVSVSEKARARRQKALVELREAFAAERAVAREACMLRKAEVHQVAKDPIERAHGKWHAERKYQNDLRRIEQGNRDRHRQVKKTHIEERRSESDDEVRGNISPDLIALFDRVRRTIKGSSRESRTEAFLKYAEQHPKEVLAALDDSSERVVRDLEAQRTKAERVLRTSPRKARYTTAEMAAVPF